MGTSSGSTFLGREIVVDSEDRRAARALAGDRTSLEGLALADLAPSRIDPALALRAHRTGLDSTLGNVVAWRRALRFVAMRRLRFEEASRSVTAALERSGIESVPIKGVDLAGRVYSEPEERPCGDLDVLIRPRDLAAARPALEAVGWRSSVDGDLLYERFLEDESYCWQAISSDGLLLELHYRLWGMMPEGIVDDLLAQTLATDEGRRLSLPCALLVAACHAFQSTPPRDVVEWWDLERIAAAGGADLGVEVTALAKRWQLELPVALACAYAGALWECDALESIAAELGGSLRWPERRAAVHACRTGIGRAPLSSLVMARLLARRRSRSGWRGLRRRIWAHPGVVARSTPSTWPWPWRRIDHVVGNCFPRWSPRLRSRLERRLGADESRR